MEVRKEAVGLKTSFQKPKVLQLPRGKTVLLTIVNRVFGYVSKIDSPKMP